MNKQPKKQFPGIYRMQAVKHWFKKTNDTRNSGLPNIMKAVQYLEFDFLMTFQINILIQNEF